MNFVSLFKFMELLSGMDKSPLSCELVFPYTLPRPDVFSFEIVCTWLNLKKKMHRPALRHFLTVMSSGLALFLEKSGTK